MASFKVPCPSCEAPVLIKDPKLIGSKVECPKCKYRFKVEQPAAPEGEAGKSDGKDKGKEKKADAKKKAGGAPGKKKKLVPILVGIGAVIVLCVVGYIIIGGGGDDKNKGAGTPVIPGPRPNPNPNPGNNGTDPEDPKDPKDQNPVPGIPFSNANTTNLLHGDTVAVYKFNVDRLRQSPAYTIMMDTQLSQMFEGFMGFRPEDVETYYHTYTGAARDPFSIIKLKSPAKPEDTASRMELQSKPTSIKGRDLYTLRPHPFMNAVAHALSRASLLGDLYGGFSTGTGTDTNLKPMGVCFYDTQHILLADYAVLERYLALLDANGYPPYKIALITAPEAPTPPGEGPVGEHPPPPKGNPPLVVPDPKPKDPPPVEPKQPEVDDRPATSIDTYRTLDYALKKALDDMFPDRLNPPMFIYVEQFSNRLFDAALLKADASQLTALVSPLGGHKRYLVSANIMSFTRQQLQGTVRITVESANVARNMSYDLGTALESIAETLQTQLETRVEYRDYIRGGGSPAPGTQPNIGVGPQPGMNPGSNVQPPPVDPGGVVIPPMPGDPGPMPKQPEPKEPAYSGSHVDLGMYENQLQISFELFWTEAIYRTKVWPRLAGITNQIKGKMAIYASDSSLHSLAGASSRIEKAKAAFPRGTANRPKTDADRMGLDYPPIQRVSLFADLLPYIGHTQLHSRVNQNYSWYDPRNLEAAGAWVPELLVPYYPQSSWRATSPLAPDHVFGATNFVAIAGVGLDIARGDPALPAFKKKVGITGYNWGSKLEEITDGLSNTIYLMQTPPQMQQPWIAGGGATLRGLDEKKPMDQFKYTHPGRDQQGTYALMADGSVRWIPADIDTKVLHALATRAGEDSALLADIDIHAPKLEPPKQKVEAKPSDKPVEPKKPEEKKEPETKIEVTPPPMPKPPQ